jgi:hypothetical protein
MKFLLLAFTFIANLLFVLSASVEINCDIKTCPDVKEPFCAAPEMPAKYKTVKTFDNLCALQNHNCLNPRDCKKIYKTFCYFINKLYF